MIEPSKHYNIGQLVALKAFPWIRTHEAYRSIIIADKITGGNILKTRVSGAGSGVRFKIKGANIISYLKHQNERTNDQKKSKQVEKGRATGKEAGKADKVKAKRPSTKAKG